MHQHEAKESNGKETHHINATESHQNKRNTTECEDERFDSLAHLPMYGSPGCHFGAIHWDSCRWSPGLTMVVLRVSMHPRGMGPLQQPKVYALRHGTCTAACVASVGFGGSSLAQRIQPHTVAAHNMHRAGITPHCPFHSPSGNQS